VDQHSSRVRSLMLAIPPAPAAPPPPAAFPTSPAARDCDRDERQIERRFALVGICVFDLDHQLCLELCAHRRFERPRAHTHTRARIQSSPLPLLALIISVFRSLIHSRVSRSLYRSGRDTALLPNFTARLRRRDLTLTILNILFPWLESRGCGVAESRSRVAES
jgi:hypothetical protein